MATLNCAIRSGVRYPIAPVYTPRGVVSRSAMNFIVLTLGAPVIDAQGNNADMICVNEASVCAVTVEVICSTVG